jgi:hypothetical protein
VTLNNRALLTILLLTVLVLGCAPRPPSWPPFPEKLGETSTWYVDMERFQRSAHGGLTCGECHADVMPGDPAEPHPDAAQIALPATALYDYGTCEPCHPQEYAAYERGVHAEAAVDPTENGSGILAPTCGDCHNAHYATAEARAGLLSSVSETCGSQCHAEALESYEQNYHGKAALLGYQKTATCTDCHGAHHVLALFEKAEAISACRRCHTDANTRLVGHRIHAHETLDADPDDPRAADFALFFWVRLFFTLLVVCVLGFFYTHTGLWFLRSLHERLRGKTHD